MRELRSPKGALAAIVGLLLVPAVHAAEFTYTNQGKPVSLAASLTLVAVRDPQGGVRSPIALPDGIERLGGGAGLRIGETQFVLVRARPSIVDGAAAPPTQGELLERLLAQGFDAQPVFELGGATKFPADEVLVGFAESLSLEQVRERFAPLWAVLRLRSVRPSRERTFVVTLDEAAGGRAFEVSRALASSPGVRFAEPNFVVAYSHGSPHPPSLPGIPTRLGPPAPFRPLSDGAVAPPPATAEATGSVSWTTIVGTDFSDGAPGWVATHAEGATAAEPAIIESSEMHSPPHGVHMTAGGPAGVKPENGPAPYNCRSYLLSPAFDASGFDDVFVELWFQPYYDDPQLEPFVPYDYGRLLLVDAASGEFLGQLLLAAPIQAIRGAIWQKALWRIPWSYRRAGLQVAVEFTSDASGIALGLFVDDIRVLGAHGLGDESPSADTYSSRQYEWRNRGQVAGLGTGGNDIEIPEAWALGPFARSVLIAVLGDGVEAAHPDLVVRGGFDVATGELTGEPREPSDRCAQAAAGIAAAIADNGIGIAGAAPGFPLLAVRVGSTDEALARAIDGAVDRGARVILHTTAYPGELSQVVYDAQHAAIGRGAVIVAPVGDGQRSPAWVVDGSALCSWEPLCVGASSPTDELKQIASSDGQFWWQSSGYDGKVDLVAPGTWNVATDRRGAAGFNADEATSGIDPDYTAEFGGSAASAAQVAGAVALMLDRNPALSPANVRQIIASTARDLYSTGRDAWTGYGRLDARAALQAAIDLGDAAGSVTTPEIPAGATGTEVGKTETYTLSGAVCSRGEPVQYVVDWGDGSASGWLPPGITAASHAWGAVGGYELECKARCAGHTALVSEPSARVGVGVALADGPNLNGWNMGPVVRQCKRAGSGWKCAIKGKMRVRNDGNRPSPATTYDLRLYYPVPIQGVPPVRLGAPLPALKAGASKTVKFNEAIAQDVPQASFLWAILDPVDRVQELNEIDNYVRMTVLR